MKHRFRIIRIHNKYMFENDFEYNYRSFHYFDKAIYYLKDYKHVSIYFIAYKFSTVSFKAYILNILILAIT